jgi:hypothetical protein
LEICLRSTSDSVAESNVVQRLTLLPTEADISFFASHFNSVSGQREIRGLEVDLFSRVLSDSALCLESEDSLFRFIETLCGEDESYRVLIDFVEAQYLSDSCIGDYISFVEAVGISGSVWKSICGRLLLPVAPRTRKSGTKHGYLDFPVPSDASPAFTGIFRYLCKECKGNPHVSNKIRVSANDENEELKGKVYDLISTPDPGKPWGTWNNAVDHYIKIDFRDSVVRPSGYTLKAHNYSWGGDGYHTRSWRFQGSNDGSQWDTLDTRSDSDAIMGNDKEAVFSIVTDQWYRFFRIIVQGTNSSGDYFFSMQRIEIYGSLAPQVPQ